jgi:hypothetical protein
VAEAEEERRKNLKGGDEALRREEKGEDKEIPPETTRDLRVFPANPNFVSQPVLSEEYREAIWERIMKEGQSVREVSAQMKVEMSRVGAVVRLKEIEKEWQRIVSSTTLNLSLPMTIMMIFKKID